MNSHCVCVYVATIIILLFPLFFVFNSYKIFPLNAFCMQWLWFQRTETRKKMPVGRNIYEWKLVYLQFCVFILTKGIEKRKIEIETHRQNACKKYFVWYGCNIKKQDSSTLYKNINVIKYLKRVFFFFFYSWDLFFCS